MRHHTSLESKGAWALAMTALFVAFLSIGGCKTPGSAAAPAESSNLLTPTLWEAQGPGGANFHLFGSVHVGRPDGLDLGPRVEGAFSKAEELVVEVDLSDLTQEEAVRLTQRYGVIQPPEDLHSQVSDETWTLLTDYLARRNQPVEPFNQLTPWLVATTIAVMEFRAIGFDPEAGVDQMFVDRASVDAKPIVGLETMDGQFGLLAGLPESVQEMMLRDTLERASEFRDEAFGMIEAWERGDDAALERIVYSSLEQDPSLQVFYDRVFFERNRRMTERLAKLSTDGKPRFVVVGAGHMLGGQGIPSLLEARGFRVTKVQ